MSKLLNKARNIIATENAIFTRTISIPFPKEPIEIMEALSKIKKLTNKSITPPSQTDLDKLLSQLQEIFKKTHKLSTLPDPIYKNKLLLPFLLGRVQGVGLKDAIFEHIKNDNSGKLLKREILAYFLGFDEKTSCSVQLGIDIYNKLSKEPYKGLLLKALRKHTYLFQTGSLENASKLVINNGFVNYLEELHFNNILKGSNFSLALLDSVYQSSDVIFPLIEKWSLFKDLYNNSFYRELYNTILSKIIGILIIKVDKSNDNAIKLELQKIVIDYLGDPRLKNIKIGSWLIAGNEARSVFLKWLTSHDLHLFFNIIGKVLSGNAQFMWDFRKKFWEQYEHQISNVWVCFGTSVQIMLRQDYKNININYGKFYGGGNGTKSCIIIELGNFIFVERSHDGSLKVFLKSDNKFPIGTYSINEQNIINAKAIQTWNHLSPQTYHWQRKVANFIQTNC